LLALLAEACDQQHPSANCILSPQSKLQGRAKHQRLALHRPPRPAAQQEERHHHCLRQQEQQQQRKQKQQKQWENYSGGALG